MTLSDIQDQRNITTCKSFRTQSLYSCAAVEQVLTVIEHGVVPSIILIQYVTCRGLVLLTRYGSWRECDIIISFRVDLASTGSC